MKNVKAISVILYYLTLVAAILYAVVTLYALISLSTEFSYVTGDDGKYFSICYPFTETPFLNGENNWAYKVFNFLIPISFYGVFFLLISNVFMVFRQPKLFTEDSVRQLKRFYLANIFAPILIILLARIFAGYAEEGWEYVAVIHFFIGVFAYFFAAIFKQGLHLQNEQDLYI